MKVMIAISPDTMPIPSTDTHKTNPQETQKHKNILDFLKLPFVKIMGRLRLAAVRKELDQALEGQMREELARLIAFDLKARSTGKDETSISRKQATGNEEISISRKQATGREIVPEQTILAIQQSLGIQGEDEIAAVTNTQDVNEFTASAQGRLIVEIGSKLGPIFADEDFYVLSKVADREFKGFIHAGHMLVKAGEIFRNKEAPSTDRIRASIVLRAAKSKHAAAREGIISMAMIVGVLKDKGSEALKAKLSELPGFTQEKLDGFVNSIIKLQREYDADKPESLGLIFKALTKGASAAKSAGTLPQPA